MKYISLVKKIKNIIFFEAAIIYNFKFDLHFYKMFQNTDNKIS